MKNNRNITKMPLHRQLDLLGTEIEKMKLHEQLILDKAMSSNDPDLIFKAANIIKKKTDGNTNDMKSYLVDPLDVVSSFGYKNKSFSLSYDVLKRMARTPIINIILKTRINQISNFLEPQKDKYSTGFVIRKKQVFGQQPKKPNKEETKKIIQMTDFILGCGSSESNLPDFDSFVKMIVRDSLRYDQMTFEIIRDRRKKPVYFIATDASTYRIADTYYDDEDYYERRGHSNRQTENGFLPSYVQILNGAVESEFYPWELCFGVRNVDTDIYNHGYGVSELEEIVSVITAQLWADEYNRRFFSQGSMPKGLLKIESGSITQEKLQEFRQSWQSMMSGVYNSHRLPVIESGKVDFINLQQTNRDMEYKEWQNYLIKVSCGIFAIAPEEIGFPMGNGSENKAMFERDNQAEIKHSQDKGLKPILKFLKAKLNKYIIEYIDPNYELDFVGIDSLSQNEEIELITKKLGNYMTFNEVRSELGLKNLGEIGDIVGNSIYYQYASQMQQQQQGGDDQGMMGGGDEQGGEEDFEDKYKGKDFRDEDEDDQNDGNNYDFEGKEEQTEKGFKYSDTFENIWASAFRKHINE